MAKWWNRQTHDAQNVAPAKAWEFDSPLGHCGVDWSWFPARSHKPFDAGSNPASATWTAEYANVVKRPGREPGDRLWVRFPPRLLVDPVVQRRRLLAHIQATMVRVHPGSLVCRCCGGHASVVRREGRVQVPGGPLRRLGCW